MIIDTLSKSIDFLLESDYKSKNALLCDLTFWAVEFLYLVDN